MTKPSFIASIEEYFLSLFATTTKTPPERCDSSITASGSADGFDYSYRRRRKQHDDIVEGCRRDAVSDIASTFVPFTYSVSLPSHADAAALHAEVMDAMRDSASGADGGDKRRDGAKPTLRERLCNCLDALKAAVFDSFHGSGDEIVAEEDTVITTFDYGTRLPKKYLPYRVDTLSTVHRHVRLARCGFNPIMSGAYGPCCRSFLAAPRCNDSDDDPLSL